jgi:predicted acetyltransferase
MLLRRYEESKDRKAVYRIFEEVGWLEEGRDKKKDRYVDAVIRASSAYVAVIRNEAECFVATTPGSIRHREEELRFCAVTAVVTSRIARKMSSARRLTAMALAVAAEKGDHVAGLGIFDQGFYNSLGFGNGPYQRWIGFDPSSLKVDSLKRPPHRLALRQVRRVHESRLSRLRGHGSICILPFEHTQRDMALLRNGFGLGFFDAFGKLSHFLWLRSKGEHGPYVVDFLSYRSYGQFLELLSLIGSFAEQVFLVTMREPPEIQLQDLLKRPLRHRQTTKQSQYENYISAQSYYQLRMLDLKGCVEETRLPFDGPRFNLRLTDPIEEYLPARSGWKGLSGDYTIQFGRESSAADGGEKGLPVLSASVGAFSRMWMGVRSASSLSATDDLKAPEALLKQLDDLFRLPAPMPDWDF